MALTTTSPRRSNPGPSRNSAHESVSRAGSALLVVAMFALVTVMVAGISLAVPLLRHTGRTATSITLANPASTSLTLGQPIRTSFGSLTASEALLNNGLSSEDLGGMSHGVSNLVGTGSVEVDVVVSLTNTSKRAVGFDAGQFKLLVGPGTAPVGKPIKATNTTLQAGLLAPGTSVDARVTFVTATNGSALWLQYADPAGGGLTRIGLGRTNVVKAPAAPHQH